MFAKLDNSSLVVTSSAARWDSSWIIIVISKAENMSLCKTENQRSLPLGRDAITIISRHYIKW